MVVGVYVWYVDVNVCLRVPHIISVSASATTNATPPVYVVYLAWFVTLFIYLCMLRINECHCASAALWAVDDDDAKMWRPMQPQQQHRGIKPIDQHKMTNDVFMWS